MAKQPCKRNTLLDRVAGYDEANLRCARIILNDRAKYERLNASGIIIWAERVLERLAPKDSKT